MLINEDFFDEQDIDTIQTDNIQSENYEMQNGRLVAEILNGYMSVIHIKLDNANEDYVFSVCDKLKKYLDMLPSADISKIIVGSSMTFEEHDRAVDLSNEQFTYQSYLMLQTKDDHGIQLTTNLFFGIKILKDHEYILAMKTLTKIINICKMYVPKVEVIWKYISYENRWFITNNPSGYPAVVVKDAIMYAKNVQPNMWPLMIVIKMLNAICGNDYRDTYNINTGEFIETMVCYLKIYK